jgi:hypothetical protein
MRAKVSLAGFVGSSLVTVGAVVLTVASLSATLVPAGLIVAARSIYRAARTATGNITPLQRGL